MVLCKYQTRGCRQRQNRYKSSRTMADNLSPWVMLKHRSISKRVLFSLSEICQQCLNNLQTQCKLQQKCPSYDKRSRFNYLQRNANLSNLFDHENGWENGWRWSFSPVYPPSFGSRRWTWCGIRLTRWKQPLVFTSRNVEFALVNVDEFRKLLFVNIYDTNIRQTLTATVLDIVVDFLCLSF